MSLLVDRTLSVLGFCLIYNWYDFHHLILIAIKRVQWMQKNKASKDQSERLTKIFIAIFTIFSGFATALTIVMAYRWIGSSKPFDWAFWVMIVYFHAGILYLIWKNVKFGRDNYWGHPSKKK